LIFAIFGSAHNSRINCDEMAGDRLIVCEQELLYRLSIFIHQRPLRYKQRETDREQWKRGL